MGNDAAPPESWVILARLLRPQGRKGEILADLLTDFPERFADRQGIFLRRPDGSTLAVAIESHWLPVGRNAGRVVLKLQGIDSINAADPIAGCDLVVLSELRIPLDADAAGDDHAGTQYIADLLDCTLLDGEHTVGIVQDVHFPATSTGARIIEAAPLLVVQSPTGDEILVPFAKSWIDRIDIAEKRITMRLPEGLLTINR